MQFWPDIIVTKSDAPEVLLVVEIKMAKALADLEAALKEYLARTRCPAGVLVSPATARIYRNRYTHYTLEAIELLGECPAIELLGAFDPRTITESTLEQRVERWLESLRASTNQTWPPSVRDAIESCVLPAVLEGVIRAAGPRWRKTGS